MPITAELPKVGIRNACAGCQRSLPFTEEHFFYCLRCGRIFCRDKCLRVCLCGAERCYLCIERIQRSSRALGQTCEKCAPFLDRGNTGERR